MSEPTCASTADFRFVYVGPAGTFTPLHHDVYGSYSWSANVVGRKLWWLFPPGTEPRDRHGNLLFDVRDAKALKVLQEEGEVIFVPSGWHHQVLNLDFVSAPPGYSHPNWQQSSRCAAVKSQVANPVHLHQPQLLLLAHPAAGVCRSACLAWPVLRRHRRRDPGHEGAAWGCGAARREQGVGG